MLYSILTRDLGLVRARALGARKEVSKLRSGLEPISLSDVSLVKGQANWRLTSVFLHSNTITLARQKKKITRALNKALALLEKLVQGEEKHPELFDSIEEVFLYAKSDASEDQAEDLEIILVSRILFHLGYLGEGDVPEGILRGALDHRAFDIASKNKKKIVEVINSGIRTTGLA